MAGGPIRPDSIPIKPQQWSHQSKRRPLPAVGDSTELGEDGFLLIESIEEEKVKESIEMEKQNRSPRKQKCAEECELFLIRFKLMHDSTVQSSVVG